MWIVIPQQCCPCVLGRADLSLALNSQCLEQDPFVMSRGKPMSPQSLQRAWKTKPWMAHLSGLTLKPSIQNRGVDAWISSLRDIRVSHSPSPEPSVQKKTRATSGHIIREIVRTIEPGICFFENVSHHLRLGFEQVHDDLRSMGYQRCGGFVYSGRSRCAA